LIESSKKKKAFIASQMKDLVPESGYHAMRTYVGDKRMSKSRSKAGLDVKEDLNKKFKTALKKKHSKGAIQQKQEVMDIAIDNALRGYNSTANKVVLGVK
jgi:hypothetical protein